MIERYENKHEQQLLTLLKDYPMDWGDNATETVVALEDGIAVGTGSLSKNSFHPHREYVKIFVQPDKRKKGIGKSIFQELVHLSKSKTFQAAISSKDERAVSFLESCGFQVARKCYTPLLSKNHTLPNSDKEENYLLFNELTMDQKNSVIHLQLKNYRQFHRAINPMSDAVSFDKWKAIVLEKLAEDSSFVWIKEGAIEAYFLCYEGIDADSIEIAYIGGRDVHALDAYLSLYRQAIDLLVAKFSRVEIEADDVDPFAFTLLNAFSYDKNDSWDAYIYGDIQDKYEKTIAWKK